MKPPERRPEVGLVVAMANEANILASSLELERTKTEGPFIRYQSPDQSIVMITPGLDNNFQSFGEPVSRVGKVPSALAANELLSLNPKVIINCGTAGGMAGTEVGDIIVGTSITQHDVSIPFPGNEEFGRRSIKLDSDKIPQEDHNLPLRRGRVKEGVISTGESFTLKPEETHLKESGALAKDMEGFAVIETIREICGFAGTVLAIKAITDLVNGGNPEEFTQNFNLAMENLAKFVKLVISVKNLSEF